MTESEDTRTLIEILTETEREAQIEASRNDASSLARDRAALIRHLTRIGLTNDQAWRAVVLGQTARPDAALALFPELDDLTLTFALDFDYDLAAVLPCIVCGELAPSSGVIRDLPGLARAWRRQGAREPLHLRCRPSAREIRFPADDPEAQLLTALSAYIKKVVARD